MDIADYLKLPYTVKLKPYPNGSYYVEIVELPGCMSEGDSLEEALLMIEDAKLAWLRVAIEAKYPIPLPIN